MDRKNRAALLASDLVKSNSREALSIRELISLLIEDAKDALVSNVDRDEIFRLQGQAQALTRLRRQVTDAPMNIKPTERTN